MVATHIKKIKHNMLCLTGVYLRDNQHDFVILHLNVSRLSVCFSCNFQRRAFVLKRGLRWDTGDAEKCVSPAATNPIIITFVFLFQFSAMGNRGCRNQSPLCRESKAFRDFPFKHESG